MGKSRRKFRAVLLSGAVAGVIPMHAGTAQATVYYWDNVGPKWETSGDWTLSGGGPSSGFPSTTADTAEFITPYAGYNPSLTSNELISNVLIVGTTGTFYTFSGSNLTLSTTLAASGTAAIADRGNGGVNVFNNQIVLGAANSATQTFYGSTSSNTLTFNGLISSTNTVTLAFVGSSATAGGVFNLNNSSNSYSGGTNIGGSGTAVTVDFVNGGLGMTGNIAFNGGSLVYETGNSQDISARIANSSTAISLDVDGNTVAFASGLAATNTGGLVLAATGGGSLSLNAADSYSGGTTIGSGSLLNLGNAGALGTSNAIVLTGNASLNNTSGAAFSSSAGLSLKSGSLTFAGTSSLTLAGSSGISTANRTITITNNLLALNGSITDGGAGLAISKAGVGTLALGATNYFTGGVSLNAGQLNINNAGALGSGALAIAAATTTFDNTSGSAITISNAVNLLGSGETFAGTNNLAVNGNVALSGDNALTVAGGVLTLNGTISGAFNFSKGGAGVLALGGSNTYSGVTSVTGGTLRLLSANALGATSGVTIATGTLDLGGQTIATGPNVRLVGLTDITNSSTTAATYGGTITVPAASTATIDGTGDITLSGSVNGASGVYLTKNGNNTVVLTGATADSNLNLSINSGTLLLSKSATNGASRGTSGVQIAGGTVRLGANDQLLETQGGLFVTAGTFDMQSYTDLVYSVQLGDGTNNGTITGTTGVISSNNAISLESGAVSGILGGSSVVTKSTAGTVTLSSASTYSGNTSVTAGTLRITAGSISNSTNVIIAGGVLELDNSSALSSLTAVTISSGSTDLAFSGTEQIAALTLGTTAEAYGTYNASNSGGFITGSGAFLVAPTPEPTSLTVFGIAGAGLLARRRRRISAQ